MRGKKRGSQIFLQDLPTFTFWKSRLETRESAHRARNNAVSSRDLVSFLLLFATSRIFRCNVSVLQAEQGKLDYGDFLLYFGFIMFLPLGVVPIFRAWILHVRHM